MDAEKGWSWVVLVFFVGFFYSTSALAWVFGDGPIPELKDMPPHPGFSGMSTLDGIDVNGNQVRDDLEWAIYNMQPNNTVIRGILYSIVLQYQGILKAVNPIDINRIDSNFFLIFTIGKSCLGSEAIAEKLLRPYILDTYDRSAAYLAASEAYQNIKSTYTWENNPSITCPTNSPSPNDPFVGPPTHIKVPSRAFIPNSYTISWGAIEGATRYELEEVDGNYNNRSCSFINPRLAYSGSALTSTIAKDSANYFCYRVRACNATTCSIYRVGDEGIIVDQRMIRW